MVVCRERIAQSNLSRTCIGLEFTPGRAGAKSLGGQWVTCLAPKHEWFNAWSKCLFTFRTAIYLQATPIRPYATLSFRTVEVIFSGFTKSTSLIAQVSVSFPQDDKVNPVGWSFREAIPAFGKFTKS